MFQIITGLISGIVSGTGMGGGTILILALSVFQGINQHTAQATNLVYFVPTAISAIITNLKNKTINLKIGLITASSGIVGAIIGAIISIKMDVKELKKIFGIFLALIALYEIYEVIKEYINKRKGNNRIKQKNCSIYTKR